MNAIRVAKCSLQTFPAFRRLLLCHGRLHNARLAVALAAELPPYTGADAEDGYKGQNAQGDGENEADSPFSG